MTRLRIIRALPADNANKKRVVCTLSRWERAGVRVAGFASIGLIAITTASGLIAGTAPIPWPSTDTSTLRAFTLEHDGTGWALFNNDHLRYYAGNAFHPLVDRTPPGGTYYPAFLGDAAYGIYLQRCLNSPSRKMIYRLIDGAARLHCKPLFTTNSHEMTGNTYIAHDGRVVIWSLFRLALWRHDTWTFHPTPIPHHVGLPIVIEYAGNIVLVNAQTLHVIDPEGGVVTHEPDWKQMTRACFHWQGPIALRMVKQEAGVEAFDLLTGNPLPLPPPVARLDAPIKALIRSSNGTLWAQTTNAVYRLDGADQVSRFALPTEDANIMAIAEEQAAEMDDKPRWDIFGYPSYGRPGLWRWNADGTERWDANHGIKGSVLQPTITADRTLWFLSAEQSGWQLFRLPLDPPRAPTEADPERWQFVDLKPATRPMKTGGFIAFVPATANGLLRWDGATWSEQPWLDLSAQNVLVGTAWDDRGTVYLRHRYGGAAFDTIAEFTPTAATLINDGSTPDRHMLVAMQRSAERGASRVSFNDEAHTAVITPAKKIWFAADGLVWHFDGTLWSQIRFGGTLQTLTWSPQNGAVLHIADGGTLVFTNGLFERRTGPTATPPPLPQPASFAELADSLLKGRTVNGRYVDAKGNLWFWLKQECRAACFRLSDLRLVAHADPVYAQPDSLKIVVSTTPTLNFLQYEYRLDGAEEWQPLLTPQGAPVRLRFAQSGSHTCEVSAVIGDLRLPQTTTFTHAVQVTLPQTRLLTQHDEALPLLVTEYDWCPPVAAVATAYAKHDVCELVWRRAASNGPWQPMDVGGRFPLWRLETNGNYRIVFAAREEKIQYDPSPVLLTFRLALDNEGQLLMTLDNLVSDDPFVRSNAERRLLENHAHWGPLLQRMREQAQNASLALESLERLNDALRKIDL